MKKPLEFSLPVPLTPEEERVLAFYPGATATDWEDWRWQLKNRIRTLEALQKIIPLTEREINGVKGAKDKLTMSIPPYFAALMDPHHSTCPIRLQSVPLNDEFDIAPEELLDPLGEEKSEKVHGLVHRYPDRALFLVNEMCAMYCRYCTRSRMVGDGNHTLDRATYDAALQYIREHPEVRDVLISGGDPLTLADRTIDYLLSELKSIPHVEFVRIGTRIPITLPQRITKELLAILKKHAPIWMSIHVNHPKEMTARAKHACNLLADHGIAMGSQTVLLKGINDSPDIIKKLMHELLKVRIHPYYLLQCDPIIGSKHFRTSIETGLNIIENLRGHTSGYAVPSYIIDGPGGFGKVQISPNYLISRNEREWTFRNYAGEIFTYVEPEE